jgi:hypothetical protein
LKSQTFKLSISTDGVVRTIYNDAVVDLLQKMGKAKIKRASHVEPNPNGDGWIADMLPVGGPVLGPYPLRINALDAEVEYLHRLMY